MLNKENTLDKSHLSAPCWRNTQKKRALKIPSSLRMTATLARTLSGLMEKDRGDDRSGTGGEPHREGRLPLGA